MVLYAPPSAAKTFGMFSSLSVRDLPPLLPQTTPPPSPIEEALSPAFKTCSKCKLPLPRSLFSPNYHTLDGLHSWCKPCKAGGMAETRRYRSILAANGDLSEYLAKKAARAAERANKKAARIGKRQAQIRAWKRSYNQRNAARTAEERLRRALDLVRSLRSAHVCWDWISQNDALTPSYIHVEGDMLDGEGWPLALCHALTRPCSGTANFVYGSEVTRARVLTMEEACPDCLMAAIRLAEGKTATGGSGRPMGLSYRYRGPREEVKEVEDDDENAA